MTDILFHGKDCKISKKGLNWDKSAIEKMIESEIILTNENLNIKPKKELEIPIIIPINQIKGFYIHQTKNAEEIQDEIILKNKPSIFIYFAGSKGYVEHGSLINELTKLVIAPKLKKMYKKVEKFSIEIPPGTKTSELKTFKCPSCNAPLEFMPPCNCEHCGVLIVLKD